MSGAIFVAAIVGACAWWIGFFSGRSYQQRRTEIEIVNIFGRISERAKSGRHDI